MSVGAVLDPEALLEAVRAKLPQAAYETWFSGVDIRAGENGEIVLQVPSQFARSWIERKYAGTIAEAALTLTGERRTIRVEDDPDAVAPAPAPAAPAAANVQHEAPRPVAHAPRSESDESLHPQYTLAHFVVGDANRLGHAAVMRLLACPGEYNPLFLYGPHGFGKTHLLQATARAARERLAGRRVVRLSGEDFVNSFARAFADRKLGEFRQSLRRADLLLVDDVHVLAQGNKAATQEEFLHTFDALVHAGKQVVLTADRPPERIENLHPKLRSRFCGGLAVELAVAQYDLRLEIVQRKAAARELLLPPEAAETVARHCSGSVREIEGAVGKLAAAHQLGGLRLTGEVVTSLLGLGRRERPRLSLQQVAEAAAAEYGVTVEDLVGRRRTGNIRQARQMAMLLTRGLTAASLSEIGRFYGGRNHSTVLAALKSAPRVLDETGRPCERAEAILLALGHCGDARRLLAAQGELRFED